MRRFLRVVELDLLAPNSQDVYVLAGWLARTSLALPLLKEFFSNLVEYGEMLLQSLLSVKLQ